ncbi:hypothetical protein Bca4012_072609 [Brassica carinata]
MQFALWSSTSDEVHHAIFKASKVVCFMVMMNCLLQICQRKRLKAYLTLMKILTLQGLAVETVQPDIGHVIARCIPTKNTFATTVSNIDQDLAQEKCVPRAR